ncbi:MAG: ATPase with chaperone activity [Planctomycetia bacterium]|nr:MAG: ATPase with chaperone activity [Planctomycetia bacterium]
MFICRCSQGSPRFQVLHRNLRAPRAHVVTASFVAALGRVKTLTSEEAAMGNSAEENLLAHLAGHKSDEELANIWASVEATAPKHDRVEGAPVVQDQAEPDPQLDQLLDRINRAAAAEEPAAAPAEPADPVEPAEPAEPVEPAAASEFVPIEPESLEQSGLTPGEIDALILKLLMARGELTGRGVADLIRLPFVIIDGLLQSLKGDQVVYHKGSAPMNDYVYRLTEVGRELSRLHSQHCTYFGSAPVDVRDYIKSVQIQTLVHQRPTIEDLHRVFHDLLINKRMLNRIGPAINSGRGMFLFGAPGNGKSSIAERVTAAFGKTIWIPRTLYVYGEMIRLFDPNHHFEQPLEKCSGLLDNRRIDKRWVRIQRPTIVVGGELTMQNLEVTLNPATGVGEAPLQLKSNCGTLVIDDFGRQRMSIDELLNRWIVPLEKRVDFLSLASGMKIEVPFDQLIVFSTNLEPRDLVDDAFLRRIPYKIEVTDPSEKEFRDLFELMAPKMGVPLRQEAIDYLIRTHYVEQKRSMRYCHPRDLLLQICNFCRFTNTDIDMTPELFDMAVENYFAVM